MPDDSDRTPGPCRHGHGPEFRNKFGQCAECKRQGKRSRRRGIPYGGGRTDARKLAQQEGKPTYNTGQPCSYGHMADRYVAGGACAECIRLLLTKQRRAKGMQPQKRLQQAAKERGEDTFNTGKPCRLGHLANRWSLNGNCCECTRLRSAKAYAADPAKSIAASTDWRKNNLDRARAVSRAAYYRNLEENRAKGREEARRNRARRLLYGSSPEVKLRRKEAAKAWKAANPDIVRAGRDRYRMLMAGAAGSITPEEIDALLESQGYRCAGPHCQAEFLRHSRRAGTLDHVLPLSRGGPNTIENAQMLCKSCNSSKNNKTNDEWHAWLIAVGRWTPVNQPASIIPRSGDD